MQLCLHSLCPHLDTPGQQCVAFVLHCIALGISTVQCFKKHFDFEISMKTLNPYISGLERAFDKIPQTKIIYWEVAISIKGQNNSISSLTKEPYYHNISGQK